MNDHRPTLGELCSPFFLYLATFRRNSATSRTSMQELHESLARELEAVRDACAKHRLLPAYERIEYALVAAADQVVLSSSWPHKVAWQTNLFEVRRFQRAEGGKRFYRMVEEIATDGTDEGAEIAKVLFTCMALGFRGQLIGERKELERCRQQLFEKARLSGALGDRLTPDAYGRNSDRRLLSLPTANMLRLVAIALAALVFLWACLFFTTRWTERTTIRKADELAAKIAKSES